MRSITKKLGILMAAVMVMCACLVGCSGGTAKKEDTLTGKYVAQFNALDMMNKEMSEAGVTLKTDMMAEFELELKEDNTFTFDMNAEAFKDAVIAGITADVDDIMKQLFESLGVDTSDMDALAKQAGYDSYDAFKEDMIKELSASFDDAAIEEMKSKSHGEGKYEVKDKTVTLTSDGDAGVDELTINDDGSLTTKVDLEGTELELVFKKQ